MPENNDRELDKLSIFILEDRQLLRKGLSRILQKISSEIIAPETPAKLETILQTVSKQVQLAILDVNLDRDGWEGVGLSAQFVKSIRTSFPKAKIVLLTSASEADLSQAAYNGLPILEKPITDISAFHNKLLQICSEEA
ncbi:MAG: DNA-binding NarL/FixJ family response regulator [Oceanicoccus sp.]|jgi:DNA-binding NarL/FixJ family response regulator